MTASTPRSPRSIRRALAVGAAAAVAFGLGPLAAPAHAADPTEYIAENPPVRVLETREDAGVDGADDRIGYDDGKPEAGDIVVLDFDHEDLDIELPEDATAVALHVTGVAATAAGHVTVYPCVGDDDEDDVPNTSTLNLVAGATASNLVFVELNEDRTVCLFTFGGAHLVADLNGTFPEDTEYRSREPVRILETRDLPGDDDQIGYEGSKPAAGQILILDVTTELSGVDADAEAVVLNLTYVEANGTGYVTVWECDGAPPTASNLNLLPGGTRPNLVVAPVSGAGTVCIYVFNGTHLVADLSGWFPSDALYETRGPERVLETRVDAGVSGDDDQIGYDGEKPAAGSIVEIDIADFADDEEIDGLADAEAVVLNVTSVAAAGNGYVTAFPCNDEDEVPTASNLNVTTGVTVPNLVVVGLSEDGKVCLFSFMSTHLIADLAGWFPAGLPDEA